MIATYVYDGNVWVDSGTGGGVQRTVCDDMGDQITHVELPNSTTPLQQLLYLHLLSMPGWSIQKCCNHTLTDGS